MRAIILIALVALALVQPTISKADFIISGIGSVSCGKIAETYRLGPKEVENLMMYWAQGFMSGANISASNGGQYRDLQAMTTDEQLRNLTEYCNEHPMADFVKAVLDLYGKLPMKKYTPPASSSR